MHDHVSPPWGTTPPDNTVGEHGFGFDRFGARVPAVLISPLIAPGFGDVLTLTTPRTDDALAGVTVPVSGSAGSSAGQLSVLEAIREELIASRTPSARAVRPVVQDPGARP
jgi:phospholipase C